MESQYNELIALFAPRMKRNVTLARFTSWRIGGPADLFFDAQTKEELVSSIVEAKKRGIPVYILGGGTNVLISDSGVQGLVVKNHTSVITIRGMKGSVEKGKEKSVVFVECDSGVPTNQLVRYTLDEGLRGLEMHLGLPGTVGGAVVMNAKWMNPPHFIGDVVYQVEILNSKCERMTLAHDECRFSYGESRMQKTGECVISVVFAFERTDTAKLWDVAERNIEYRKETQPQGVQTAGCVFKNISASEALSAGTPQHTTSAGYLLDKAGLKGRRVGGAEFSAVHANFIITTPGARASDVLQLISEAKERVKTVFGVRLREEIHIIGRFP